MFLIPSGNFGGERIFCVKNDMRLPFTYVRLPKLELTISGMFLILVWNFRGERIFWISGSDIVYENLGQTPETWNFTPISGMFLFLVGNFRGERIFFVLGFRFFIESCIQVTFVYIYLQLPKLFISVVSVEFPSDFCSLKII